MERERDSYVSSVGKQLVSNPGIHGQFFVTVAGPGDTPYPADGQTPPVNVYRAMKVYRVRFTESPGAQSMAWDESNEYRCICNLEPAKYIELGSLVLGFEMHGRWFTIDKVPGRFITHRKYDVNGNELWNADHGALVFSINVDASGNVYVFGQDADDGAYVRRYNSAGSLTLSIQNPSSNSGSGDVIADSSGNIIVLQDSTSLRKYDSDGNQIWSTGVIGGAVNLALASGDGFYVIGNELGLYDSSGGFVRFAAETSHDSGGSRVSARIGENTVMDNSVSRWSGDLTTEFSAYRAGASRGIDHSGNAVWLCHYSSGTVKQAGKYTVVGTPSTNWETSRRDASVTEEDIALFDSGNAKVMIVGNRHSNITHQARDAGDGSLLWERDHGGDLRACCGATDAVYVAGARVTA